MRPKLDRFVWIIVVLGAVALAVNGMAARGAWQCHKRGGIYLHTYVWYACVVPEIDTQ